LHAFIDFMRTQSHFLDAARLKPSRAGYWRNDHHLLNLTAPLANLNAKRASHLRSCGEQLW